jgi:mannobiose 2-epimerase
MKIFNKIFVCILIATASISCVPEKAQDTSPDYSAMADTLEQSLFEDIVDVWYPRIIDKEYGGYLSNFSYDWQQLPNQDKYLVYVARHIWTLSMLYKNYPERTEFLEFAEHGFKFLTNKLWDQEAGGYYLAVDQAGVPLRENLHEKRIYGQAFAIYGLAEYYSVSKDPEVLEWARKSFEWIENNAHDPVYGGYFEFLHRNGSPVLSKKDYQTELNDSVAIGLKDYNSSIHILEALTTLYTVWPDPLVKERLEEMFHVVRDTMVTDPGYLLLYFKADWTPVTGDTLDEIAGENLWFSNHVTFGHDIETSYLLHEAAEALGIHDERTTRIIKQLTDHTLMKGWDNQHGGIYDKGKYVEGDSMVIIDEHKAWWGQIEGLNSMLLLHSLYPDDPIRYYDYFLKQWDYLNTYQIDHVHGGWYGGGLDKQPESKTANKAHAWKTTYHNSRGMVNCINTLRKLETTTAGNLEQ